MLSRVWVILVVVSFAAGALNGTMDAVGAAAMEGAKSAVELCIAIAGPICLWSGVMELLRAGGMLERLGRWMKPVIRRLFPSAASDPALADAVCANLSANVLGLGNAATPMGMEAARRMGQRCVDGIASAELCRLVVVNTASLQLIPATVAAIRAGLGAPSPFDILPAVWPSSAISLAVGLTVAWLCERASRRRRR